MLKGREGSILSSEAVPEALMKDNEGFHGPLGAAALLLREDDRIVLSVDFFFTDIPSWLEYDVETKKLDTLTTGDFDEENPVWSPDGKHLAFASNRTAGFGDNTETSTSGVLPISSSTLSLGIIVAPFYSDQRHNALTSPTIPD